MYETRAMSDGTGDKRDSEIDQNVLEYHGFCHICYYNVGRMPLLAAPEKFAEGRLVREVFVHFYVNAADRHRIVELKRLIL